jgi:rod shape determining protein RodA
MTTFDASLLRKPREQFDFVLFSALAVLGLLGACFVYSATRTQLLVAGYNPHYYEERQFGFVVGGIVAMYVLSRFDYRRFDILATPAYLTAVLALAGVFVAGSSALGAQRWYNFGFFQVQPSEFTVLVLILAVATFSSRRNEGLRLYDIVRLLTMVLVPVGLIVLQPDLGTSIIIILVTAAMMAIAGVPPRFMSFLAVAGGFSLVGAVYFNVLHKYQVDRFVSFINQNSTNKAVAALVYEVANAKTAIGNGGLFGQGAFSGMQTTMGYVPEQRTDFIFTAIGEQFGLVGAVALIALISLIAWRIWRNGRIARDIMGRVMCVGVLVFFSFSAFENIGMTMGIMPVTGIPLPLVSYGGSAVLVFYLAGGLVLSVSRRSGG